MQVLEKVRGEDENGLASALVASSTAPLLLLDEHCRVVDASPTFCASYDVDCATIEGQALSGLGDGEWDSPKLASLLSAVLGGLDIPAYEMDLVRSGHEVRRLVVTARKLAYPDLVGKRVLLTITDITEARASERLRDDLIHDKQLLLAELQHRVGNSLQIISSVLMQSARTVQSDETRTHLHDAHHRIMAVATLQKQLSVTQVGQVELRPYLTELCKSIAASMIPDQERLKLIAEVGEGTMGADQSVSLGLIVTELVINSLKHAFPGRRRIGQIHVKWSSQGDQWTLTVTDNGIGMKQRDSPPHPGLGTSIIEALSRQLKADIEVFDCGPGAGVKVSHPAS